MKSNKYLYFIAVFLGAFFGVALVSLLSVPMPVSNAATVTSGVTFTTNQVVQYYHLNDAINNAVVSGINSGDITDGTIANVDLGANCVTSAKILNGTILTDDIGSKTILSSNMATGSVSDVELTTNLYFRTGIHSYSNVIFAADSIAGSGVAGVISSAGAADSGKIPKLNSAGRLNSSISRQTIMTNVAMQADVVGATSYTTLVSIAGTTTNGLVQVSAQALWSQDGSGSPAANAYRIIAISPGVTNVLTEVYELHGQGIATGSIVTHVQGFDTVTGTSKTYVFQGKVPAGSDANDKWAFTQVDRSASAFTATNATQMTLIQVAE